MYLGASLGADELEMRAYEAKIGRLTPLTHVDGFDDPAGAKPTPSSNDAIEKTQQNHIVHEPASVRSCLWSRLSGFESLPPSQLQALVPASSSAARALALGCLKRHNPWTRNKE
jgi:hypothetical protein